MYRPAERAEFPFLGEAAAEGKPLLNGWIVIWSLQQTIIYLASEPPSQQFLNFVEDQEVSFLRQLQRSAPLFFADSARAPRTRRTAAHLLRQAYFRRSDSPGEQQRLVPMPNWGEQGLSIILNKDKYPICVMDTQGRHRVGQHAH